MHRLRAPGGCPWDAEQTHHSLVPNLIEEAYETIDAIRRADMPHLMEELGDLLLQVVFHAELAEESGHFSVDDVARTVADKLVRRHPHVFGDRVAATSDAVLSQWDAIKREEKGESRAAFLHGVGKGLPALQRAAKLQKKAAKVGFDWSDERGVWDKVAEEWEEVQQAAHSGHEAHLEEELGDLMFSLVNLIRHRGLDPEVVMAGANRKFETRFHCMETLLESEGIPLVQADLQQMETAWRRARMMESSPTTPAAGEIR